MRAAAEAHRMVKLCHLAGIVKPCGRGRTYVEAVVRCDCANPNPNPNPNPNQVWRRRAWWTSFGCRGAGRQPTARPLARQPAARRPVAVVEDMTMPMPAPMTTMPMTMPRCAAVSAVAAAAAAAGPVAALAPAPAPTSAPAPAPSCTGAAAAAAAGAAAATTALSCCRVCQESVEAIGGRQCPRGFATDLISINSGSGSLRPGPSANCQINKLSKLFV